jgi:hypothetical protein
MTNNGWLVQYMGVTTSATPTCGGDPCRTRTCNQLIKRTPLTFTRATYATYDPILGVLSHIWGGVPKVSYHIFHKLYSSCRQIAGKLIAFHFPVLVVPIPPIILPEDNRFFVGEI